MTADELLLETIDLKYHPTLMAAAGDLATFAGREVRAGSGYILVIEGSIPTAASGKYCKVWPGMTMLEAVKSFSPGAKHILAVGSCAAFGGMTAGAPNPTGAKGVRDILPDDKRLINIPGCPAHPDWVVGTVAFLLAKGTAPPLDRDGRPREFFGKRIHDNCPRRRGKRGAPRRRVTALGQTGCLEDVGCNGPNTFADCYMRRSNSPGKNEFGVNWCIGGRSPCIGCVEADFPDGMSPFFAEGV
jgi:hydrogenase small subunit